MHPLTNGAAQIGARSSPAGSGLFCSLRSRNEVRRLLQERLETLLEPVVTDLGYELLLVEYNTGPGRGAGLLRLYIDHADGIAVEDCERVSREVSGVLDVEDPIRSEYQLEVSSPGLDRPLVKPAHFERFMGEEVKLQLLEPRMGRRRYRGHLLEVSGNVIRLRVDGQTEEFELAEIERARLVPDFDREMKRG